MARGSRALRRCCSVSSKRVCLCHKRLGPLAEPRRPQIETCGGITDDYSPIHDEYNSLQCHGYHNRGAGRMKGQGQSGDDST
jgi:hypothetical protein